MAWKKCLVLLLAPYSLWLAFAYRYHFIDGANLLFHEGGHVVFGLFGETLHFLGGSLGQLAFPVACAVHFWRDARQYEALVCLFWLGESLMYMANYMGDAQAQVLPLVGGGVHDWHWLFSRWGLLEDCRAIAGSVHVLASLLLWACLLCLAREAWSQPAVDA